MDETLIARRDKAEESFKNLQNQREEIDVEMNRLQGEWRLLNDLLQEQEKQEITEKAEEVPEAPAKAHKVKSEVVDPATAINATDAEGA